MQVVANVSRADAEWAGLSVAQQMARGFDATSKAGDRRTLDARLARIGLEFPVGAPDSRNALPAVSIQYLKN